MALVKCQDCGADVSDRASHCPRCGGPVVTLNYEAPAQVQPVSQTTGSALPSRRRFFAVVALVALLVFVGFVVTVSRIAHQRERVRLKAERQADEERRRKSDEEYERVKRKLERVERGLDQRLGNESR